MNIWTVAKDVMVRRARVATILIAAPLVVGAVSIIRAADHSALWRIVHGKCVPDQTDNAAPAPCEYVDLSGGEQNGYAVLKDIVGATQFLLIPTRRVGGVESPEILAPDAPNYWSAAWSARRFVSARAGHELPRDDIVLAINSAYARSQDQLHIHVDCVRADAREALHGHVESIGETWAALEGGLLGQDYLARRLRSPDLSGADPMKLLADGVEEARRDMARETLVVVGARFAIGDDGFILLASRVDAARGDRGHGEDLQDHACAVGKTSS